MSLWLIQQLPRREDFKAKPKRYLDEHASWAHKLVRATPVMALSPAEKLDSLSIERDKWGRIWQGDESVPPSLPSVPFSLPAADLFAAAPFVGISLERARHCARRYPEQKYMGPDLWESWLLAVLPA